MSYPNCLFTRDQGEKNRCCVDSSIFQWRLHFLILTIVLAACLQKTGGFALYSDRWQVHRWTTEDRHQTLIRQADF
jgi:hypothetical protein